MRKHKAIPIAGVTLIAAVAALVAVPVAMSANGDDQVSAHAYVFRTVEDPSIDPIPDSGCPGSPGVLAKAQGQAYSIATRASDAMVVKEQIRRVGVVRICGRITGLAEGSTGPANARIEIAGDRYTASGACRATSNGVPEAGIVLLGCALRLNSGPDGFVGGIATSASLSNLGSVPGYKTGSFFSVRVFSTD
jgi:hypothetical protein